MPHLAIASAIPNIIIGFVIFLALYSNINLALTISFFTGLAYDLMYPSTLGLNTMLFLLICLIVSKTHQSINKERIVAVLFSLFIINIIYWLIIVIFRAMDMGVLASLFSGLLWAAVYNTIITLIVIYFFVLLEKVRIYVGN
jgi:rod shape-determining protein MreD